MRLHAAVVAAVALQLTGCGERWDGFVYFNRNDLSKHTQVGPFDSLESCRTTARSILAQSGALERGDYECGLNCKGDAATGLNVCKRTER